MTPPDQDTRKKTTVRFPPALHRFLRHMAVDNDTSFEDQVVEALTEWAKEHGYNPADEPFPATAPRHPR